MFVLLLSAICQSAICRHPYIQTSGCCDPDRRGEDAGRASRLDESQQPYTQLHVEFTPYARGGRPSPRKTSAQSDASDFVVRPVDADRDRQHDHPTVRHRVALNRFPFADRPRLWGTAVSHYQVEGNDACDWSGWGRVACGTAVDSWMRYESDADLARDAGANAFRFSVSWSRIEPREGQFDLAALERYRRLVEHLNVIGLEPAVTLFHYTHPLWFHDNTPWTSTKSIERFARFASRVVEAFGDRVRFYIPLNEPLVFLLAGYLDAQIRSG